MTTPCMEGDLSRQPPCKRAPLPGRTIPSHPLPWCPPLVCLFSTLNDIESRRRPARRAPPREPPPPQPEEVDVAAAVCCPLVSPRSPPRAPDTAALESALDTVALERRCKAT